MLKVIPEGSRGYFKAAYVQIDGKSLVACWALRTDGMVFIAYADGDGGLIPIAVFEESPGV